MLSEGTHHQRSVMAESMAPVLRRFTYGPHLDARNRASYVDYAGELLEEVIIVVGDAFADILGRDLRPAGPSPTRGTCSSPGGGAAIRVKRIVDQSIRSGSSPSAAWFAHREESG